MFEVQCLLKDKCCSLGTLIMTDVNNRHTCEALNIPKQDLEAKIKAKYETMSRKELKNIYPMNIYVSYYKRFGDTYHVLPQLESIAHGKTIPSVFPLVEAMFMAELKNMLLTAGHDLEKVKLPLILKISDDTEIYTGIGEKPVVTVPGDLMIQDAKSVISSIMKGPDQRTRITADTRQVLFTIYAPEGIRKDTIISHLNDIESYIRIFSPQSTTQLKKVFE